MTWSGSARARGAGCWQAVDVVMFAQTAYTQWPDDARWLDAALEAYAVNAPEGAMDRVRRLARWLAPLGWLAAGLARLKPESRELRAVGLTLARLRSEATDFFEEIGPEPLKAPTRSFQKLRLRQSCARRVWAGRALSGRSAKISPATSVARTPPTTMPSAETGSNR